MPAYPAVEAVVEALGGARVLRAEVRTLPELSRRVSRGLPFRSLRRVVDLFPEAQRRRIEQLIVPRTTLQRREAAGTLSPEESERLERVARLTALAEHVWESREAAQSWLVTPHPLLEGEAPLDLAASELGARRVEDVLWKLEYSLPV
jgi:putative toxin-antitoxin system antitoxin component (TIGR02293 family)